ncbi:MAG: alanine racemase [Clostridia bacterium]|nr:alanine racemase [Clostridia bacterium]
MECCRSTVCYINFDQMDINLETLRDKINNECDVMVVLKADGYGHGAPQMMKHFLKKGVTWFAVAAVNEAMQLRRTCKDGEILVLGYTPDRLLHYAAENNITQTIYSYEQAKILSDLGLNAKIQIKVDTGMNRLGFAVSAESADEVKKIFDLPSLQIEGVFSHMAQLDAEHDEQQYEKFEKFLALCKDRGVTFKRRHLCNGKSAIKYPHMRYEMCRAGSVITGFCLNVPGTDAIQPSMTVETEIVRIHTVPAGEGMGYDLLDPADHDRVIATLPFGYADGIPKALSNHVGWVVINGEKCEYTGNFCMDMCMCDVTHLKDVKVGDKVQVYGGEKGMNFFDLREKTGVGLSNLQILIHKRVPRIYIENGKEIYCDDALLGE